ncbi:hypothetical protein HD554DRAFT_1161409 [Boletus coccyginus]|nr:hypothetical protein HD554DRAFT_1161409 [Boletus coccyginus]
MNVSLLILLTAGSLAPDPHKMNPHALPAWPVECEHEGTVATHCSAKDDRMFLWSGSWENAYKCANLSLGRDYQRLGDLTSWIVLSTTLRGIWRLKESHCIGRFWVDFSADLSRAK